MIQFIVATFVLCLGLVWGSGVMEGYGRHGWSIVMVALGAGWMGIIWGTLLRELSRSNEQLRLCESCLEDDVDQKIGGTDGD